MAPAIPSDVIAIYEKPVVFAPETKKSKVGVPIPTNEKTISAGETVPGWTIMRPMRMRGLKAKKGSSSAVSTNVSANEGPYSGIESKSNGDLKVTETRGSDANVGEVEALSELRSDDELLGDEEVAIQRGNGAQGLGNGSGDGAETAANGGVVYKVYKRRWFGLVQLVLLNIIVSWDVSKIAMHNSHYLSPIKYTFC